MSRNIDRRTQRAKGNVNIDFFKTWSPEMAYVLGYFVADGGMFINPEGSRYIQFTSTDREILKKIKELIRSNHKISTKKKYPSDYGHKECYLIQIGSKEMFGDLLRLRSAAKRNAAFEFPKVPDKYLNHFVRGYFDGDGSISFGTYKRKSRKDRNTPYILTSFVSKNEEFLDNLSRRLHMAADIGKGYLGRKVGNGVYRLSYSTNDSKRLLKYMYKDVNSTVDYFLKRKYNRSIKALKFMGT